MSGPDQMWAYFDRDTTTAAAARELRDHGASFTLYAPYMTHALEHAVQERSSPVRWFVLLGGLLGCIAGFSLTIWTATRWHLIVGGKPVVAIPPYLVIAFELTLLFGSLVGVLGLFLLGGMPKRRRTPGYDASLSADRFALCIDGDPEQLDQARRIVQRAGVVEVRDDSSTTTGNAGTEVEHV